MAAKNPAAIGDRWASRMSQSGDAYKQGIDAVTIAPGEAAAQAKDRYVAGVQEAAGSGRYERGCRKVTLGQWQTAAKEKGAARIGEGARLAKGKFTMFMNKLIPFQQQLAQSLPARGSKDQNIARAVAWMHGMGEFKNND